jgi:hypothetical protein
VEVARVGLCRAILAAIVLTSGVGAWGTPFPGKADDVTSSMGAFELVINPAFQPFMIGYPGYDGAGRLQSPTLFDPNTRIGHSAAFTSGSVQDLGGVPVGTADTIIYDSSFSINPFSGLAPTREVHTEVRDLDLAAGPGGLVHVRAGTLAAPARPISPGEVESLSNSGLPGDDFPAKSFFNIFAQITLPAFAGFPGATLLVMNSLVTQFPPKVV